MNETPRTIEFDRIPPMSRMLLKAATAKKPKQASPQFIPLKVVAKGIAVDQKKLAKFCDVCDFEHNELLPLTYPHIMAFALHMQLMLEPEFPFTPMGAVHIRNRIRQHRALHADEAMDFSAWVDGAEHVEKGYEVSIRTEVHVAGQLVWDDLSVMLIRKGGSGVAKAKKAAKAAIEFPEAVKWQLSSAKGRQYAAASGDYNPIHLYPITAKAMGFKRHIIHGMWSKSRVAAHLVPASYNGALAMDVAFKLPIFLPATVTFFNTTVNNPSSAKEEHYFEMKDGDGQKPHLTGTLIFGSGPD